MHQNSYSKFRSTYSDKLLSLFCNHFQGTFHHFSLRGIKMSPSFFGIFCIFLASSGVVHSSIFDYELSPHKFLQVHKYWGHPSGNDQYDRHRLLMRYYRQRHIHPNIFMDYLPEFPLDYEAEFPNDESEDIKPPESFKSDASEKSSVSAEYLPLIIRNVPSSDSASNSISSTSFETTNPVPTQNILYDDSDTKISIKDETHLGAAEDITSVEPESSYFTQDFQSYSRASQESPSTEIAQHSNFSTNVTIENRTFTSDSASNSKIEEDYQERNTEPTPDSNTDSSLLQNTVSKTNDSSHSISNSPNLITKETSEEGILSTSFEPLTGENSLSTIYSILTDSSTQSMPHQSINPVTDETGETSTIMSRDEESKLTKMTKPSTSETVSQSSKSAILSTRGSYSSVSYMTSSSNNGRPVSYSTSSDEQELHGNRDRLIVTEHETVIEISSIRTAKVVVSAVFLTIALVATGVLTVYIVKSKRREVQYDQLTLLP